MVLQLTHMLKEFQIEFGLSDSNTPEKIEKDLLNIIPKKYLKDINHLFVYHGRAICTSRNPKCNDCPISHLCEYFS